MESVTEARPVESEPKAIFENYFEGPEIIANEPLSPASDIWSLGIILYQLACLKVPCANSSPEDLLQDIHTGHYIKVPKRYSRQFTQLIESMMHLEPEKRPEIDDILCHPLIRPRKIDIITSDTFHD